MDYVASKDQVIYAVCGVLRKELNGHIRMHNMKSSEYKDLYPNSPMISENSSIRKQISVSEGKERSDYVVSDETKKKNSLASKLMNAKKRAEDEDAWLSKKRRTAEIARKAKGDNYKHSEQTLQKMRGPRPNQVGKRHTEETKKKLSEARKGKKFSPHSLETIQKMKDTWAKRKENIEEMDAYRQALSKKMSTPEQKIKLQKT